MNNKKKYSNVKIYNELIFSNTLNIYFKQLYKILSVISPEKPTSLTPKSRVLLHITDFLLCQKQKLINVKDSYRNHGLIILKGKIF